MNRIQKTQYRLNYIKKQTLGRLVDTPKPHAIILSVTSKCNLRCRHCSIWKNKERSLPEKDAEKIILGLREWTGPYHLTISGGEPLLKKDLAALVKLASDNGIQTALSTNGVLLTREIQDEIFDAGLDLVLVSLDSTRQEVHDKIRGAPGTFESLIRNIENSDYSSRIVIQTVIFKDNPENIPELVEWVRKMGFLGIEFQALVPTFGENVDMEKWYRQSDLWPDDANKINNLIDKLVKMKNSGYPVLNSRAQLEMFRQYFMDPLSKVAGRTCAIGTGTCQITADGKIVLCNYKYAVNDWSEEGLNYLWGTGKFSSAIEDIRKCNKPCLLLNCYYNEGVLSGLLNRFRG